MFPSRYAICGPIMDKDGVRIVVVNGQDDHHQTFKCVDEKTSLYSLSFEQRDKYRKVGDIFLKEEREPPAISGTPTDSYTWRGVFLSDEVPEYSALRLDDHTVVYSSQFFPKNLARVIISQYKVIFMHYNDTIIMKDVGCLYRNEKILIDGIQKIDVDGKRNSLIYPKGENALKKHLQSHPLEECDFNTEQKYIETYTKEELIAMERAYKRAPVKSFEDWFITIGIGKDIKY